MRCEYCDNPVPNGVTRCPSCGAAVSVIDIRAKPSGQAALVQASGFAQIDKSYSGAMPPVEYKNRWVYILLGLFLGGFGIHNFYSGYTGRGVVKLLITIASFGFLIWVSWLWAVVEICTVRMDSRGAPFIS